jgi:hypothetical protein
VACAWGYCGAIEPATWDADYLLDTPVDLLELVVGVLSVPVRKTLVA